MTTDEKLTKNLSELKALTLNSRIEELKSTTKKLVLFEDIVKNLSRSRTEYEELTTIKGTALVFGIHTDPNASIAQKFLSSGTELTAHAHPEKLVIGVMSGTLTVTMDNVTYELAQYDTLVIPPCSSHSMKTEEDTWLWMVTMPASPSIPCGEL